MPKVKAIIAQRPALAAVIATALLTGLVAFALVQPHGGDAHAASAGPPPTTVGVGTSEPREVRVWSDYSGRLRPVDAAEIRPEVSGRITEIRFKDGQVVKAGDTLFVIDPQPYEATVAKAKADLASARANASW